MVYGCQEDERGRYGRYIHTYIVMCIHRYVRKLVSGLVAKAGRGRAGLFYGFYPEVELWKD